MKPLAIACGDPTGIGPEVVLKAVARARTEDPAQKFVLVGDAAGLRRWNDRLGLGLVLTTEVGSMPGGVQVVDPRPAPLDPALRPGDPGAARAGLDYLRAAAEGCRAGLFRALVTAPVSKEAILRAGIAFTGQTEFLADLAGGVPVTMLLVGRDDRDRWLRVALATTHLPLRAVAENLTVAGVERAIRHAADACGRLGLPRARVGVCGLNPHAGEGGMLGDEEARLIGPAIAAARAAGVEVHGPVPGDTVFFQALRGDYDVVVAMYHDQGLAPLKLLAFETGVNWTLGLPFVRTSPDHGTAFDIAGRGIADASSLGSALRLATQLAGRSEASSAVSGARNP